MTAENIDNGVIPAAGGLIWRHSPNGLRRELAVIFRTRYCDWTLPKGKVKSDERWQDAAQREAEEETGCPTELGDFAGCISYLVKGKPKVVLFWNMTVKGDCQFKQSEEVGKVEWLSPTEALNKLDHPAEKALLMDVLNLRSRSRSLRLLRWRSASYVRLANSVAVYRAKLETENLLDRQWAQTAYRFLNLADQALNDNNEDLGWRFFKEASRMELLGLSGAALEARATAVLKEAQKKLDSWRKTTIEDLLMGQGGGLKPNLDVHTVVYATRLLDEHLDNIYLKLQRFRGQLASLTMVALALAVLWMILSTFWIDDTKGIADPWFPVSVTLLGGVGAAISGFLSIAAGPTKLPIPEQLASNSIILARLAIGGVSALVVYIFLSSGVIQIGDLTPTPNLVLAASFVAGFSERLVVRAVEAVGK